VLARTVRSGVVETRHLGNVVAVDTDGSVIARWGEPDRIYFMRSAAKPIQATVSVEVGGPLQPEEMAVACASHRGEPIHVALVRRILAGAGLGEPALRCPPAFPGHPPSRDRVVAGGTRVPAPIFHNCSGKHAAMLRACVAAGWPLETYTHPEHPLQQRIIAAVAEAAGADVEPVGVDGCGVPAFQSTTESLARAYAAVATRDRYRAAAIAMHRFPALTSGTGRPEVAIARSTNGVVKGGAAGCLGVAIIGQVGVAAKADDGSFEAAAVGMVAGLVRLGYLPDTAAHGVAGVERIPVLGGGVPVGYLEPALGDPS